MLLQGFAGLRVLEAANLREQDVDWQAGTIRIDETPHHKPKNRYSFREIPLPRFLFNELRLALDGLAVRVPEGYLFPRRRDGVPHNEDSYGRRFRWATEELYQTGGPDLRRYQARWLRSAWATAMLRAGAGDRIVKAYMGHTRGDILGEHYEQLGLGDLRVVASLAETWHQNGTAEQVADVSPAKS